MTKVTDKKRTQHADFVWEGVTEDNIIEHVILLRAEMQKFGSWIHRESHKRQILEARIKSLRQ